MAFYVKIGKEVFASVVAPAKAGHLRVSFLIIYLLYPK